MNITRETVNEWLDQHRRSRQWLAERLNTSLSNIGMWLNKKGEAREIPAAHKIIISALMEEDAAAAQARPQQNLVLEFTDEEYTAIEQAALASLKTTRDWAKQTLNDAAGMDAESFAASHKQQHLKVAEDPTPYRTNGTSGNA